MTITVSTLAPSAYRRGAAIIGSGDPYKLYGYEAMKLILDGLNAAGAEQGGAARLPADGRPEPRERARHLLARRQRRHHPAHLRPLRRQQEAARLAGAITAALSSSRPSSSSSTCPVAAGRGARPRRAAGRRRTRRRRARRRRRPGRPRPARRRPRTPPAGARAAPAPQDHLQLRRRVGCSAARRSSQSTGAAVVRVDQREAEQLVALVDVGHARDGQLEQQLAERGAVARRGDLALEGLEVAQEVAVGEQRPREGLDGRLVRLVGRRPRTCAAWPRASPSRGSREPLLGDRPDAEQRLEDEVAARPASARRREVSDAAGVEPGPHVRRRTRPASPASAPIRARTSPERLVSCVWVTSRLRGKRSARSALPAWKSRDRDAEAARVAADVVRAPAAARSGRTPCPRRPWPSPAASSAGSA